MIRLASPMMNTPGSRNALSLSEAEREWLVRWTRLPSTSQAVALRCRIVLACAHGLSDASVARGIGVSAQVVGKWRRRFRRGRLAALQDRPRSGAPRSISEEQVQTILEAVLTEPPPNGIRWTKRALSSRAGVSPSSAMRILYRLGVSTAQTGRTNEATSNAARTALYLAPPESIMVMAFDESHDPDHGAGRVFPPAPGDHDVVLRTELANRLSQSTGNDDSGSLVRFLRNLENRKFQNLDLHLICHGHGTRKIEAIRRWQEQHSGLHLHFTPDKELWLRLVERYFTPISTSGVSDGRSPLTVFASELHRWSRQRRGTNTFTWFQL
ncbi:Transposase [Actinopolyspora mzabensis]|uniref:Transposase n=1 Tax=Actinopolyspora mzabensis TaxID=995066 RepID=A0A1G8XT68_ACTMZ|nr:helix-turn-helix domain-containing protein [Actinopolyspora mzabensis]SDJ93728.1 Transposase [Actinopolyspora mzabensis]